MVGQVRLGSMSRAHTILVHHICGPDPSSPRCSGAVITEAFASSFPTVVAYVMDTPRCQNPQSFMSNMLQAGAQLGGSARRLG